MLISRWRCHSKCQWKSNVATSHVGGASASQVEAHVGVQAQAGPESGSRGSVRIKKHSCNQSMKTWPMLRPTKTWLTWQSWNTHTLTKMRSMRSGRYPEKGYFDEEDGTPLDPEQVRSGCRARVGVHGVSWELVNRATVHGRERYGQRDGVTDEEVMPFAVGSWSDSSEREQIPVCTLGVPGSAAARILLILSAIHSLCAATADFSVAFMHSPMTEEVFVEPPPGGKSAQRNSVAAASYSTGCAARLPLPQSIPGGLLEDAAFRRGMGAPSIYHREEDGVRMSVHVDDPLVIGPEGPIRVLFEWLGQRVAVKSLETFDPVRGLKYLGMVYYRIPGGHPGGHKETIPPGYIEGMASMMGVLHAKTPATPGIRTRHPTEADEKPVDATRVRVYSAIVGKAQWILRARPDLLYAVKELSRQLQGPREVDYVAAK